MADFTEKTWAHMMQKLYCPRTRIFYDFTVPGKEGRFEEYLPDPELIRLQIPNPCGWGTGMEDGMIIGSVMLEAALLSGREEYAAEIFEGMKTCATVSGSAGFLARSVSPADGKTHYADSSRDQYTHWIAAACRYYNNPACTEENRRFIRGALCAFAARARRNVRAENGYNLLREDGGRGMVLGMWKKSHTHEMMRLPMIYIAAWKIGGDAQSAAAYKKLRHEALCASEAVEPQRFLRPFALNQMQLSLRVVYDLEDDRDFKARCLILMQRLAEYGRGAALSLADSNTAKEKRRIIDLAATPWDQTPAWLNGVSDGYAYYAPLHFKSIHPLAPETAWLIRDVGDAAALYTGCPGAAQDSALLEAIERIGNAVDFSVHCSDAPCYLLLPFYSKNA